MFPLVIKTDESYLTFCLALSSLAFMVAFFKTATTDPGVILRHHNIETLK